MHSHPSYHLDADGLNQLVGLVSKGKVDAWTDLTRVFNVNSVTRVAGLSLSSQGQSDRIKVLPSEIRYNSVSLKTDDLPHDIRNQITHDVFEVRNLKLARADAMEMQIRTLHKVGRGTPPVFSPLNSFEVSVHQWGLASDTQRGQIQDLLETVGWPANGSIKSPATTGLHLLKSHYSNVFPRAVTSPENTQGASQDPAKTENVEKTENVNKAEEAKMTVLNPGFRHDATQDENVFDIAEEINKLPRARVPLRVNGGGPGALEEFYLRAFAKQLERGDYFKIEDLAAEHSERPLFKYNLHHLSKRGYVETNSLERGDTRYTIVKAIPNTNLVPDYLHLMGMKKRVVRKTNVTEPASDTRLPANHVSVKTLEEAGSPTAAPLSETDSAPAVVGHASPVDPVDFIQSLPLASTALSTAQAYMTRTMELYFHATVLCAEKGSFNLKDIRSVMMDADREPISINTIYASIHTLKREGYITKDGNNHQAGFSVTQAMSHDPDVIATYLAKLSGQVTADPQIVESPKAPAPAPDQPPASKQSGRKNAVKAPAPVATPDSFKTDAPPQDNAVNTEATRQTPQAELIKQVSDQAVLTQLAALTQQITALQQKIDGLTDRKNGTALVENVVHETVVLMQKNSPLQSNRVNYTPLPGIVADKTYYTSVPKARPASQETLHPLDGPMATVLSMLTGLRDDNAYVAVHHYTGPVEGAPLKSVNISGPSQHITVDSLLFKGGEAVHVTRAKPSAVPSQVVFCDNRKSADDTMDDDMANDNVAPRATKLYQEFKQAVIAHLSPSPPPPGRSAYRVLRDLTSGLTEGFSSASDPLASLRGYRQAAVITRTPESETAPAMQPALSFRHEHNR